MLRMTTTGPFPASWRSILKMEFGEVLLICLPDRCILYHRRILLSTLKLGQSYEGGPITEKRLTRIRPPLVAQLCCRKITPTPKVFDLFCRMLVINTISWTPWSIFHHSNVQVTGLVSHLQLLPVLHLNIIFRGDWQSDELFTAGMLFSLTTELKVMQQFPGHAEIILDNISFKRIMFSMRLLEPRWIILPTRIQKLCDQAEFHRGS